jgi:hypothetical protein
VRAGDAGWLGKHLLLGIAGGFDLGILQLGDMGTVAAQKKRRCCWVAIPRSQAVLMKSSTVFKVQVLPGPDSYILAEWCLYSGCE